MNVLMVYPEFPDTFWSFKHALSFINKKINNPPLGLLTISPLLPSEWKKRLVDLNLKKLTTADIEWADLVFISAMDVQREACERVIREVKLQNKKIIAGGPLFTAEYEKFPQVDHFVLNEAEITLPLFLADFETRQGPRRIYQTEEFADIQNSPIPDINLVNIFDYECMSIQFSRGCPFHCDFCNVTALLGHKPRMKSVAQVIGELEQLYQAGWKRNVFFVDDNFIGNKNYLKNEILPALIKWRQGKKGFTFITEASINLADDPELMRLMAEAGFTTAFIGIETPNQASLVECGKNQNTRRDLIDSIKKIHNAGIQVMAGFIVGFDHDTPSIFDQMIEFIQESGIVTSMVGILQAPNGTELYRRLDAEGRVLKAMTGDNADGTTNIIPKMEPLTLKTGYQRIINTIYSPRYLYPRIKTLLKAYQPRSNPSGVYASEIAAFLKTVWKMGFKVGEARHYWRLVLWTLFHCPAKFPLAITLSIYGYHFRMVNQINQAKEKIKEISLASEVIQKGTIETKAVQPVR